MLSEKHCALLAAHRKLTKSDKIQVTNFGNAGIKVTQMIGAFANAAGGYDKVGFLKKDLHNQILRQRKVMFSDAKGAVTYLKDLRRKDPLMFVEHTVGADGRLQHLFWSDGVSQKNFEVFGDDLLSMQLIRKISTVAHLLCSLVLTTTTRKLFLLPLLFQIRLKGHMCGCLSSYWLQ
jgi:hypothetical protein